MNKAWTNCYEEDREDSFLNSREHSTVEECIAEAIENRIHIGDKIFIGDIEIFKVKPDEIVESIIENVGNDAYEFVRDYAEDFVDELENADRSDLILDIKKVLNKWFKEQKIYTVKRVINIEEVDVTDD